MQIIFWGRKYGGRKKARRRIELMEASTYHFDKIKRVFNPSKKEEERGSRERKKKNKLSFSLLLVLARGITGRERANFNFLNETYPGKLN